MGARTKTEAGSGPEGGTRRVLVQSPTKEKGSLEDRYVWELEALRPLGVELVEVDALSEEEFLAAAPEVDAVLAYHRRISRREIEHLERCRVIACASVGTDTVDVAAATEAGIVVTNVPDVFVEEVAEHTWALILAASRRLVELDRIARTGDWEEGRALLHGQPRLYGQTLGLVSWGRVARAVARRAHAFGLRVLAWDPFVDETSMTSRGIEPVAFLELLERSDVVSLHAPLNEATHHLIGRGELRRMKGSALLVNTGRGALVDEAALAEALRAGEIAQAALDVFEQEPLPHDSPLRELDGVILSPHCAAASARMPAARRRRAGAEVALVLAGRWPRSCVNPDVLPRTDLVRWQPVSMERGPNR